MNEALEYLQRIHAADRSVLDEIEKSLAKIAEAAEAIADRMLAGGRWFYVGAGTSGRLGMVDAAELPPTFGIDPSQVVALIAGGDKAFATSIEGAEDEPDAGAKALKKAGMTGADAVLVIAASGTTPFPLGALKYAKEKGALALALVCNPGTPLSEAADIAIAIHTGAEVISGSTRMKAGTAQKMVLTMLSTTVMSLLGRVVEDEMVAMRPTNNKLRSRATRICSDLLGIELEEARALLETSDWNLPVSLVRGRFGLNVKEAKDRLESAGSSVSAALAENAPPTEP